MSKTYGESKFKLSHANDINRNVNNNSFRRVYQIYDFSLQKNKANRNENKDAKF